MNLARRVMNRIHMKVATTRHGRRRFASLSVRFASGLMLRAVLYTTILVTGTAVLMALAGWQVVEAFEYANANARLHQGERAFSYRNDESGAGLEAWARWLSEHPTVRAAARGERWEEFMQTAQPLLSVWNVDYIGLVGKTGQVQIMPPALMPLAHVSDISLQGPLDGPAQEGLTGLVLGGDGTPHWRAVVPIDDPYRPQGYVLVGYVLGQNFADRFKAATGLDVTIYAKDRVISSTLPVPTDGSSLSLVPRTLPTSGDPLHFQLEGQSYSMRYYPLYDHAGNALGFYSLSVPSTLLRDQVARLLQELFLFVLKIITVAGIAAYVLTRSVVRPLRTLAGAVTRIGEGDFSTPIDSALQDEVGYLAQQLEEMRQKFSHTLNELAIEKSLYQGIFQSMTDGVFTTDLSGRVNSANPAAMTFLNDSAPLQMGTDCYGAFRLCESGGQLLCDQTCLRTSRAVHTGPEVSKAQLQRIGDDPLDVEVTVSPIKNDAGDLVGVVHVMRDVSPQQELQRMKQRFLLSVAHELRTPLSSLAASVEILKEDLMIMSPQDREDMLTRVTRGTFRLQHLIANLLDLGSIEAGRFSVQAQPVQLDAVIQEAVDLCEPLLATKRQRVAVSLLSDCPKAYIDSRRIIQVLMNLLTNCSKYGPEEDEVELTVYRNREFLCVSVTDHGNGFGQEEVPHIFEYYYQANQRRGQESQGFGLGLAIVKGIVEAHGGEIGAESVPGHSTTIWFSVPIAVVEPNVNRNARQPAMQGQA